MAHVVGDDTAGGGVVGELDERFIVGIGENGKPARSELPLFRTSTDGIEQRVDLRESKAEFSSVRFQDFLILVDKVIAEDGTPAVLSQSDEDIERVAATGAKSGIEDIGIEDGADHSDGSFSSRS